MSPDNADPEVPAGGKQGLRKRLALISASVLFITAGAFAYYHNAWESEASLAASGSGLRRPQGRRLPHYTTYGGTSYDFAGPGGKYDGDIRPTVPRPTTSRPAGCCCTTETYEMNPGNLNSTYACHMKFTKKVEYNPTMPPVGYNPTMPPLFENYNPTRPPPGYEPPVGYDIKYPGHALMPGDKVGQDIKELQFLWKVGFKGCCCSHEVVTEGGRCTVGFMSPEGTWVR